METGGGGTVLGERARDTIVPMRVFQDERGNYLKASNCLRRERFAEGRERERESLWDSLFPTGGGGTGETKHGRPRDPFQKNHSTLH